MTAPESQDIILYAPKSNLLPSAFMGIFLPVGLALPFFAGWQWLTLLLGFLFIITGIWAGLVEIWKMLHNPVLVINTEGIYSPVLSQKARIKWEEMAFIYFFTQGNKVVFAVDASPTGLIALSSRTGWNIPHGMDITVPQEVLSMPSTNLPIPDDQILVLIHERFSAELERYSISLEDGYEES
jgi:hypothetical protein